MHHIHHQINHLPLIVCTLFLWFLGATWYSPALFAKPWAAIVGRKTGEKPKGVVFAMISSLIGDFLLAFVMAHFVIWSEAGSFLEGALIGFICWVGFVLGPLFPQHLYEGRPRTYFFINAGYWFIGMVVTGGILAIWR